MNRKVEIPFNKTNVKMEKEIKNETNEMENRMLEYSFLFVD
jgi:hypothetical protein